MTSAATAVSSDQDLDQPGQPGQGGQGDRRRNQSPDQSGQQDWSGILEEERDDVRHLVTELAKGQMLSAASAARLLGVSQSTGGRRLRRARELVKQRGHLPDPNGGPVRLSLVSTAADH
jgi:hypothetical protein